MAETNPPKATVPPVLDWSKAEKHLDAIKTKVMEYAGKAGHNPFIWWAQHGQELETKLAVSTNRTPSFYAQVLAFTFAVPSAPDMGINLRKPTPRQQIIIK
jgi:hypothetical protein